MNNKEYQHPEYDLTIVERCNFGPRDVDEFVEIPHTHTGYGASAVELSNDRYLESDSEMIGRLNLDNHGTMFWYANVRDYTDEQWEELEELVTGLNDYLLLCDETHSEVEQELMYEYVKDALPYDTDVTADDFFFASLELGIYVEPDGDTFFITEEDFAEVLKFAEELKKEELATV